MQFRRTEAYGSIMHKIFLVAHLTYKNTRKKKNPKIQRFVFFGPPIVQGLLQLNEV